jgi:ribonuclease HI
MITLYFDGACEPVNPGGHASYGFVVYRGKSSLIREYGYLGHGPKMSNNVAEYTALYEALSYLQAMKITTEPILARGDSKLVIEQMSGRWASHGGLYVPYMEATKTLAKIFNDIMYEWIPREQNSEADELSKRVLTEKSVHITVRK